MSAKNLLAFVFLGFVAIVVIPAITLGQYGGFGGKGGGKGGGQKMMDPSTVFDMYANGQPYIKISSLRRNQDLAVQYAKDKGISNGQLTRAQFLDFSEQVKTKAIASMNGGGGGGKGGKSGGGFPGGGGQPKGSGIVMQAPATPDFINGLADVAFRKLDANSDGKLNQDEMPDRLKNSLGKWDKNGDGFIDLVEYREFYREEFASRFGGGGGGAGGDNAARGIASIFIEEEELDKKTVVFRAGGKMPEGLPAWFKELDTDGDGQVGLYEWRKGGKALEEFKDWDLNDDGFITPEEAAKVQAAITGKKGGATLANSQNGGGNGNRPAMGAGNGGRPNMGDWKGKGNGKKGKGYGGGGNGG